MKTTRKIFYRYQNCFLGVCVCVCACVLVFVFLKPPEVVRARPDSFFLAGYPIFLKHCVSAGPDGSYDRQTYVNVSKRIYNYRAPPVSLAKYLYYLANNRVVKRWRI